MRVAVHSLRLFIVLPSLKYEPFFVNDANGENFQEPNFCGF